MRTRIHRLILGLTLSACAEDLTQVPDDKQPDTPGGAHVAVTADGADVSLATVDASSESDWVYLDLESLREVIVPDRLSSGDWDLAFQRYRILTNGGVSGARGMEGAPLPGAAFADVTIAPDSGWIEDRPDGEDTDTDADTVLNSAHATSATGWYTYDADRHLLSPARVVYVVKSVESGYFAIEPVAYYSDVGEAGHPKLRIKPVPPPASRGIVDASRAWVYLDLATGGPVVVADPTSSTDWDLAVFRAQWKTNSGVSGPGKAGARLGTGSASAAESSPTVGFEADESIPIAGPPGSGSAPGNPVLAGWYDYDAATHVVTPRPSTFFFVRGAKANYGKVSVETWDGGKFGMTITPLLPKPEVVTATVATSSSGWAYLDLRGGRRVSPDPPGDESWDLGFRGTTVRTHPNGGAIASAASFEALTTAPEEGYVPSEGSPNDAQNPELARAFDASGRATGRVFALKLADGSYAKATFGEVEGGISVRWAYAGPGRLDLGALP
ncbi:MAG: HmuY family protein [Deltaproteobacteria bacterium]|nr:HmuY family protein [Deltaproteobacteria bacterium]